MRTPYELFNVECMPGWRELYEPLVKRVKELGGTVDQVKEKFGGLRFYYSLPTDVGESERAEVRDAVVAAEERSFKTCEVCGNPGERRSGGWIKTLCDNHARENATD